MKRKTSTAETRIYTYGCLAPDDRLAMKHATDEVKAERAAMTKLIRETVFRAHRYRNLLVEQARKRLVAYRELRRTFAPAMGELEEKRSAAQARVEAAFEAIRLRRQEAAAALMAEDAAKGKPVRKKYPRGKFPELDAEIAAAKDELEQLRAAWKEECAKFDGPVLAAREEFKLRVDAMKVPGKSAPVNIGGYNAEVREIMLLEPQWSAAWKAVAALERDDLAAFKIARKQSGLSQGTYTLVEAAVKQATKEAKGFDGPEFKRFTGGGRVGVQFKKGLRVEKLLSGTGTFLRIRLQPHQGKADRQRALVDLRVGSDEKAKPVWVTLPMMFHRPPPKGALVKSAWIKVTRKGLKFTYELQLTLELAQGLPARETGSDGSIALHLAWRQTVAGLRVGYLVDSEGKKREVIFDSDIRTGLEFCRRLRGFSDRWFDLARAELERWKVEGGALPEWGPEELKHLGQWRAHRKLARVVRRWTEELAGQLEVQRIWTKWRLERLERKQDLMAARDELEAWLIAAGVSDSMHRFVLYLEWWRRKDGHLVQWEAEQRTRMQARRKNDRRVFARRLAEQYRTLVVDKMDLRPLAKKADPDKEDVQYEIAREQRHSAAPSELRDLLKLAFGPSRTVVVDHAGVASVCAQCGAKYEAAEDATTGRCENGHVEDRDANACRNMLIRAKNGEPNEGDEIREGACSEEVVEEPKESRKGARRGGEATTFSVEGA